MGTGSRTDAQWRHPCGSDGAARAVRREVRRQLRIGRHARNGRASASFDDSAAPTLPPVEERTAGVHLVRGIRKWDLVALVLNSIVGAGIFGLPSRAYALAGVHSLLAYVVCAVPMLLIILCFAEVGSRFNDTGGPYLYARITFG